jgi:small subunit ribosomal protein S5
MEKLIEKTTTETTGERQRFVKKKPFDKSKFALDDKRYSSSIIKSKSVSRTRSGGRIRRNAVLIAVFDKKQKSIGIGKGKGFDKFTALRKAENNAKKKMVKVNLLNRYTPSHNCEEKFKTVKVILKQSKEGSGLKAGGTARKILKLVGVTSAVCKSLGGSMSPYNVAYAVIKCFESLESIKDISERLGKNVGEILQRKY